MNPQTRTATPDRIVFAVRGIPVVQGSPRAFVAGGRARVVSGATGTGSHGQSLHAWRTAIATEARSAMAGLPSFGGPVSVLARFVFGRPRSHLRSDGMTTLPRAPRYPRLDIDKLSRALLDGLAGVCFDDDSQVVWLSAEKAWDDDERGWQGVEVTVSEGRR